MKRNGLIVALLFTIITVGWSNMLTNPGFESGTASWIFTGEVGVESWASRSGSTGATFKGWVTSPASLQQEVSATNGTYTFAVWVLKQKNHASTNTELRLNWLDSGSSTIQVATVTNILSVPQDGSWHHVFVTGTCTSQNLAKIRVTMYDGWGAMPTDPRAYMVDDADLYPGAYDGSRFENGSFDMYPAGDWYRSRWNSLLTGWNQGGNLDGWGSRTSTNGNVVAFYSWDNYSNNFAGSFSQNVNPVTTGTYCFSIWNKHETNALFSNLVLRMEWYDVTLTNRIQTDNVTNLITPNDGNWYEYYVQGECTNPAVHEVRLIVSADWTLNADATNLQSTTFDDARFLPVPYSEFTNAMLTDWCYHSSIGYNARNEQVPGTNVGSFMQVSYGTTSVIFYVLAESPSQAKYYPIEDNRWEVRTAYKNPTNPVETWVETYSSMTRMGDVVIPSSTPFHGLPVVGSKTASLWKLVWPMPKDDGGLPYTNHILVYYAPFTKTTNGAIESSYNYLLALNAGLTNNLGQEVGRTPQYNDYFFDLNPNIIPAFTNGGFEEPTPVVANLDGTGWSGSGDVGRETWAARSGAAGVAFRSYNAGLFALYQDIATTGGTYQFAGWMKVPTGAVPTMLKINMQWYDKSSSLVQENSQDLLSSLHKENDWSRIGVVGSCTASNLDYVRLLLVGQFSTSFGGENSTEFDDMEFGGVATNLQNVGFETGNWRDIRDWYGMPQWLVHTEYWANRTGSNGVSIFGGYTNDARYEAELVQPIVASTGSYVFSVYVRRQEHFVNLTNAQIKLEWYGGDYPVKVQADTVVTIAPSTNSVFSQYSVTGTCNNANLRFVQPVVLAQWDVNPSGDYREIQIDDASLVLTNLSGETYTDGIPDSWWDAYGITGDDCAAARDYDNDGYLNIEEYAGDTDPTANESYFSNVTNAPGSKTVMILIVNPSSTGRVYDAYWKTNLMDYSSAWQNYGLSVTGSGGSIELTVTNKLGKQYFRTGAKLP